MIKKLIDTIGDPIPPAQNIDNPDNRHQKDQCVQRAIGRESRHFHVFGKKVCEPKLDEHPIEQGASENAS